MLRDRPRALSRSGQPSGVKPRIPLPVEVKDRAFTTARGADVGLSENRLRGPDLNAPFHGIRIPRSVDPNLLVLCSGYQLTMHPLGRFCGPTAALLMGVPLPRRRESLLPLHVAVPRGTRAPKGQAIRGHEFDREPHQTVELHGLRLSPPERVWCELATMLGIDDLVAAGDSLINRRRPFTTALDLEMITHEFAGRRGVVAMRAAYPLLCDSSDSRQETRLRLILVRAGLPQLTANPTIVTSGGFTYRGDLVFMAEKVIVEYQGDYHRTPEQFAADMTRASRLEADGWRVILVGARDLDDPVELVSRIRRVLAQR